MLRKNFFEGIIKESKRYINILLYHYLIMRIYNEDYDYILNIYLIISAHLFFFKKRVHISFIFTKNRRDYDIFSIYIFWIFLFTSLFFRWEFFVLCKSSKNWNIVLVSKLKNPNLEKLLKDILYVVLCIIINIWNYDSCLL